MDREILVFVGLDGHKEKAKMSYLIVWPMGRDGAALLSDQYSILYSVYGFLIYTSNNDSSTKITYYVPG